MNQFNLAFHDDLLLHLRVRVVKKPCYNNVNHE